MITFSKNEHVIGKFIAGNEWRFSLSYLKSLNGDAKNKRRIGPIITGV
jgi:hypothetical protein